MSSPGSLCGSLSPPGSPGSLSSSPSPSPSSHDHQPSSSRYLAEVSETRYYIHHAMFPFEEDERNEFKMHTNFTDEEIPETCRGRRRAISRAINGFLNSGKGGTVYIGVEDMGEVLGKPLSLYQREHLQIVVEDLRHRYNPPIPSCLVKMQFVPVVKNVTAGTQIRMRKTRNSTPSSQPHLIRTSQSCWCSKRAHIATIKGFSFPLYVVELIIHPPSSIPIPVPGPAPMLKPIFSDEKGRCFVRRAASVCQIHCQQVVEMTIAEITQYYTDLKKKYLQEMTELCAELKAQQLSTPPASFTKQRHKRLREFITPPSLLMY